VNCKNICNKAFEFRNVIDTYNPDVMGTESWLSEEVINAGVLGLITRLSKESGTLALTESLLVKKITLLWPKCGLTSYMK